MLKKDNTLFGVLIGLVLPALFYGLLSLIGHFVKTGPVWARPFEPDRMMLLSIFINLLPIRLYFVSWKMEKTGRGVLLITVVLVIGYFAMKKFLV
jgi:hypothetical protein